MEYLDKHDIHVICIQESKLPKNAIKKIPGYKGIYKYHLNTNNQVCGGLIVYVKDSINHAEVTVENIRDQNGETKVELQIINLYLEQFPLTLVNLYSRGWNPEVINKLNSLLAGEHKDSIITGDFNAHHVAWGSTSTDRHGEVVWNWVTDTGKVLLNDGSPTRVGQALTCLDLTIASPRLSVISDWGVMEDTWGSDHFPIITSIQKHGMPEPKNNSDTKFNYKKADWEKFKEMCEEINPDGIHSTNVDMHCQLLTEKFLFIAGECIPVSRTKKHGRSLVPWWNKTCNDAVKGRKKLLNKLKRNPCPENCNMYMEAQRSAAKVI